MRNLDIIMTAVATLATPAASLALALGLASAGAASAEVVYSDFGPGQSYDTSSGLIIGDSGSVVGETFDSNPAAMGFTPTSSADVSQIDIALNLFQGSTSSPEVAVSLWTDVANAPGAALGSWDLTGLPFSNDPGIETISGISGVSLSAGQSYFLEVDALNGAAYGWNLNSTDAKGDVFVVGTDHPDSKLSAFDVVGSATPEPATWAMLLTGVGMIGVGLRIARRRNVTALPAA
jgi:hypothetical protein